jgi:uncharacterized protein YndB with AHSA1/START domain
MSEVQITVVPGRPQVLITREFDAPLDLVVRAHVEPDLLAQWWGPRGPEIIVDRYEVRDGGRWRVIHREPDGAEFAFRGVFHGEPSAAGIVQTFEYEGWPGQVSLQSMTFEERDGRTIVRTNAVYPSVEARDAMVEAGMARGVEEGSARLDELLGRLKGPSLKTRHD